MLILHWKNSAGPTRSVSMQIVKLLAVLCLLATCNKSKMSTSFSADQAQAEKSTESFTPEKQTYDKLDILLVIDESGSMTKEHESLSTRLNDLLSAVSDSDWQIAITTTNPMSCLLTVIDSDTPNYERIFAETIDLETLQASYKDAVVRSYAWAEQAAYSALRGLRGDCIAARAPTPTTPQPIQTRRQPRPPAESDGGFNSICHQKNTWVRDGSMLAVLLITDEDHQCTHDYGCHLSDFYFYLKSIRNPHATGRVYGLLNENDSRRFLAWQDENGESLFDYHESINSPDYTKILTEISQNISAALKNNFALEHAHDGDSATVVITTADGETQPLTPDQYNVEGDSLSINTTLPANTTKIEVTYTH